VTGTGVAPTTMSLTPQSGDPVLAGVIPYTPPAGSTQFTTTDGNVLATATTPVILHKTYEVVESFEPWDGAAWPTSLWTANVRNGSAVASASDAHDDTRGGHATSMTRLDVTVGRTGDRLSSWVRFNTNTSGAGEFVTLGYGSGTGVQYLKLDSPGPTSLVEITLCNDTSCTGQVGGVNLTYDTWYRVELVIVATGQAKVNVYDSSGAARIQTAMIAFPTATANAGVNFCTMNGVLGAPYASIDSIVFSPGP
jgi:hypothetical protein